MTANLDELFQKAEYEWPCWQCGRLFVPRVFMLCGVAKYQRCCGTCALRNLEMFMEEPDR